MKKSQPVAASGNAGGGQIFIQMGAPERTKAFLAFLKSQNVPCTFDTENGAIVFKERDLTHIFTATAALLVKMQEHNMIRTNHTVGTLELIVDKN